MTALLALALAAGKVAILPIEASGAPPEVAESASLLVPTEVRRLRPDLQVISAEDVRTLLAHQRNQQILGCSSDPGCARELGGALGADEIIGGKLGRLGGTWVLEMRRIDTRKSQSLGSATRTVSSTGALVSAVRSSVAEILGVTPPPAAPAAGGGQPAAEGPAPLYAPPAEGKSLPSPSVVKEEAEFEPIEFRGLTNRAVYDAIRDLLAGAQVPIDRERAEGEALLRLRTGWMVIEKGRRLRFRVRVGGQITFDVDREACGDNGCAETWDVSKRELELARATYALLRGPVEKGER